MTSIAIAQTTSGQVKDTDEKRDKHVGLVHVGNRLVHCGHNTVRHRLMSRYGSEGRAGDSHEE